jgi:hypothetical protein
VSSVESYRIIYEKEEENVSCYWMIIWTRRYDGNLNKMQQIDLFGELALEWTMGRTEVKNWGEKQWVDEDDEEGVGSYWINVKQMIILVNKFQSKRSTSV